MGTYTGQNAIDFIKRHIKGIPLDDVQVILVDQISALIHTAYPWSWTLDDLTPIDLEDGVQDYSIADVDYYRPVELVLVDTHASPMEYRELTIREALGRELSQKGGLEQIRLISPLPGNKLRLERAASIHSPVTLQIQGTFQKLHTKIAVISSVLTIPDHYFTVFTEGLLWRAYKYADDPRAGSIQVVKGGGVVYTGQMGVFYALLKDMMIAEDAANGEPSVVPAHGSFGADAFTYGLFGGY